MRTRYTLFKSETEPIVIIMAILLVTGTINVFSSSYVLAAMNFENPYYFLQRHLQWLLIGIVACWICRKINYQRLRWHTPVRGLTLSTFYDMGTVRLSKTAVAPENRVTLRGWGIGAAYSNPGDWFARVDYARRIGLDPSVSAKNNAAGRVWFMAGKIW